MLFKIIKQDWRLLRADRAFSMLVVMFSGFLLYGIYTGAQVRNEHQAEVTASMKAAEEKIQTDKRELLAAEAKNITHTSDTPLWVAHPADRRTQGIGALPSSLALLSIGQSDLQPAISDEISPYKNKYDLFKNYEQENPAHLLTGRFDWSFVIVFLLPLLIFTLTYNLLSGERENGTLALTLAQPVKLQQVVAGKILARFFFIIMLTLGASLAGIVLSTIEWNDGAILIRLFLAAGAIILYAAFWFSAGIIVISRGLSTAVNATVLIGIWLFLIIVLPALIGVGVSAAYPLPSRLALMNTTRQAENESSRLEQQLLGKYFGDHPQLSLPEKRDEDSLFYVNAIIVAQDRERRIAPQIESFEEQLRLRQEFVNRYRFASPAIIMQEALNDLSGTGRARQNRFVEQVRLYYDNWRDFITPYMFNRILLKPSDYDRLPRFQFQDESVREIALRVSTGLLGLLLPAMLFIFLALKGLKGYPVND